MGTITCLTCRSVFDDKWNPAAVYEATVGLQREIVRLKKALHQVEQERDNVVARVLYHHGILPVR